MKKSLKLLLISAVLVLVLSKGALALFAMGSIPKIGRPAPAPEILRADRSDTTSYDPELLKKFISAIRSLDFNKPVCTYSGVINMDDPNDTTNTIHRMKFRFCRVNSGYYYQLGAVEIVHQGSLNIYVQHDQHKVVISDQQIVVKPPINDLSMIMRTLHSESYKFHNTVKGTDQTLAIINDRHLTCKEISVTINTKTGKLERIYTRLNDFGSPMDKGKDREMDVQVHEISSNANRKSYPMIEDFVYQKGGKWALTTKYATYELIML